jgi:hypothetical protein
MRILTAAAFTTAWLVTGATFEARFGKPGELRLHTQGAARAVVADGSLLLDMRSPTDGKHAWAETPVVFKLPLTVEWDQMTEADSPHFYRAGLFLKDAFGRLGRVGFCGKPQGNVVAFNARLVPDTQYAVGTWYRFRLEVGRDHQAKLSVRPRDAKEPVWTASGKLGTAGLLCALGFYQNQEPQLPPDAYAQDRGASRFANLRVEPDGIHEGSMETYRDPEVRGYSTREPMAFNRTMRWIKTDGAVIAYDGVPEIHLTGDKPAADWSANRGCTLKATDATASEFVRPNDLDGSDTAALRCFQWCLRQHPILTYGIQPQGGACSLEVTLPCPYVGRGIRLFKTDPSTEPVSGNLDLRPLFAQYGLSEHQYGEIGIYLDQERGGKDGESRCRVSLSLTGSGALITTVPVVRSSSEGEKGVVVSAIFAGGDGTLQRNCKVTAKCLAGRAVFKPGEDGVYTATLPTLIPGRHWVDLVAHDATSVVSATRLLVVIAKPDFPRYVPGTAGYQLPDGTAVPSLLGDLLAWVPTLNPDQPDRRVIPSAAAYEALPEPARKQVRLIKLRTLGRRQIAAMLAEQARNGCDVIRLTPNVTPHESFLDAGGHIAPYSLESLSWVLDECRQRGIRALINVFHYPYWSNGTGRFPPWRQYLDAGYRHDRSFLDPAIAPMLHEYLAELLVHLRDDPAVLGYSLTGENDQTYGPDWINALYKVVRTHDPNHVVTLEQGGGMERCSGGNPSGYDAFLPAKSGGIGYRTYYTGGLPSDAYMMLCGRFYSAHPPAFMAEVASGPGWYGGFHQTWTHPDFLTKMRDAIWMTVLRQQTICVSWSAPWTQEERLVPSLCLRAINWDQLRRQRPPTAVRLGGDLKPLLPKLGAIESELAAAGIDYDFVWDDAAAKQYAWVIDPDQPLPEIPEAVRADRPLTVSPGHSVNLLRCQEPFQMLAFVKNTASYRLGPGYGHGVKENHRQRTDAHPVVLTFANVPAGTRLTVFDVDTRKQIRKAMVKSGAQVDLGTTAHDFALVLTTTPEFLPQ